MDEEDRAERRLLFAEMDAWNDDRTQESPSLWEWISFVLVSGFAGLVLFVLNKWHGRFN